MWSGAGRYLEIVRNLHPDRRHTDDMERFHQASERKNSL